MRKEIKEKLLHNKNTALEQARLARIAPDVPKAHVIQYVHNYVCYKFFLNPEDWKDELLYHLAEKSIEEAIHMKIPFAKESEMATTCGAAGSAAVKVGLLMVAIKKDFQVEIPSHKMAFAKNTEALGELVYAAMHEA